METKHRQDIMPEGRDRNAATEAKDKLVGFFERATERMKRALHARHTHHHRDDREARERLPTWSHGDRDDDRMYVSRDRGQRLDRGYETRGTYEGVRDRFVDDIDRGWDRDGGHGPARYGVEGRYGSRYQFEGERGERDRAYTGFEGERGERGRRGEGYAGIEGSRDRAGRGRW